MEILTGIKIENQEDLLKAAHYLHNRGVKRVFITLGKDGGVFYSDGVLVGHIESPDIRVINATGAGGDAFVAALAYGHLEYITTDEMAKLSMAASICTLSHKDTINPNMSIDRIKSIVKEIK